MRLFFLLLILFIPTQASAQDATKVFNAENFMLDNGMQVVVIPNHRTPVVTHMVWYKTGAADEPQGKSGIAHFLEHLMFKGSGDLAPGEFSETVRSLGGNDNAFTSQDYTAYFQSIASEHLETVMRMEAGRMRGLNPPPQEVESERKVILEERRQRIDNDPRGKFSEQMTAALYADHPYGIPTIGWLKEMEMLSWEDAKSFYDQWYQPNNAVLIVSGDVTGPEVLELAQRIYGPIEATALPERMRTAIPMEEMDVNSVFMAHKDIHQPVVQILFRVPGYHQSPQTALAFQVLEEIAGGGPTSRFYKSLVVKQKIATSAGVSYDSASWDDATFRLYALPAPGTMPERLQEALEKELKKLISKTVSETELLNAVSRLQNEAIYARDSLSGPAMIVGRALATGSSLNDIEYWPHNIAQITAAQIQEAAETYLGTNNETVKRITGYLLPLPASEKKKLEKPTMEVFE